MKKIIISSLAIALTMILVTSCRKDDINGNSKNLISGSYITLDSVITQNLDFSKATATVGIIIGSKGDPVASVDIYLAKNTDDGRDTTQWVHIKNVPYSDGVTLTVSTAELTEALAPDTIAPGNEYKLQNVVNTKAGKKFSVINTPDTYNSFPGYNMAITWKAVAVCPYTNNAAMAGDYKVVADPDWQDWTAGSTVPIKAGAKANELDLSGVWPNPAYGTSSGPWYVDIDPETGESTVPAKQVMGHYTGSGGYNLTVDATPGSGFVFSCTGVITLKIPIFATGFGSQGVATLILKKM